MATAFKKFIKGILLKGETSDASDNLEGSIFLNSSDSRIKTYVEGAVRQLVTNSQSQVLTQKTINADNNTISELVVGNFKSGVLNTDLYSGTPTNLQIPSALAVKNIITNSSTVDVSELDGLSSGFLTEDHAVTPKFTKTNSNTLSGNNFFGFINEFINESPQHFYEDFESGSFSTNSWTVVNGSQPAQFYVGTVTKDSGNYSAYISDNLGLNNYDFSSLAKTVHFYKDINTSGWSSDRLLSFRYKLDRPTSGNCRCRVIVAPVISAPTPVAGTEITSTPAGGMNEILPSTEQIYNAIDPDHIYKTIAATYLPPNTTVRIIFSYTTDAGFGGMNPALSIDNIRIGRTKIRVQYSGIKQIRSWDSYDSTSLTFTPSDIVYISSQPGKITFSPTPGAVKALTCIESTQKFNINGDVQDESSQTFNLQNNQTVASNITGLLFNSSISGFILDYYIVRSTSEENPGDPFVELAQFGTLRGAQNPITANWYLSDNYTGQNCGITFSIDNTGQIKYQSTSVDGIAHSAIFRYSVSKLFY